MERQPHHRRLQVGTQPIQSFRQATPAQVIQQRCRTPAEHDGVATEPRARRHLPDRIGGQDHRQLWGPALSPIKGALIPPTRSLAEGQNRTNQQSTDPTPQGSKALPPENHLGATEAGNRHQQEVIDKAAEAGAVLQQAPATKHEHIRPQSRTKAKQ